MITTSEKRIRANASLRRIKLSICLAVAVMTCPPSRNVLGASRYSKGLEHNETKMLPSFCSQGYSLFSSSQHSHELALPQLHQITVAEYTSLHSLCRKLMSADPRPRAPLTAQQDECTTN